MMTKKELLLLAMLIAKYQATIAQLTHRERNVLDDVTAAVLLAIVQWDKAESIDSEYIPL